LKLKLKLNLNLKMKQICCCNFEKYGKVLPVLLIITSFLTISCQSQTISLSSNPSGADVFEIGANGEKGALKGQTPLKLESSVAAIQVSKTGFTANTFLLPEASLPRRQEYKVNLQPQSEDWFQQQILSSYSSVLSKIVSELFDVQNNIKEGKFDISDKFFASNNKKYEQISIFQLLKGHHFYLKKEKAKALESYEKALSLDPKNEEARQMKQLLSASGAK
jgi:hypothetical protein